MSLKFLLLVLWSVIRQRAFALKPRAGALAGVTVTPQGEFLPQMAGGDETPEEKDEREAAEAAAKKADEEREAAEDETRKAEEEAEERKPKWDGEFDQAKAERAVENARRAEDAAKERARKAEAEADELRQAQETEHETAKRQAEERRVENERLQESNRRLKANEAIREAAADEDVPAKKVRRLMKLVDRDSITFDADGEVEQESVVNAVAEVLDEFPEFKAEAKPAEEEPPEETPGGAPDRKRKPKKIDRAEVERLAKEEPDELNRMIDEDMIPASALG